MNPSEYLDQNKKIQSSILDYIENDETCDQNFQNLIEMINNKNTSYFKSIPKPS